MALTDREKSREEALPRMGSVRPVAVKPLKQL